MHNPNEEPSTGPAHTHILPPRMPDPSFVETDPPSTIEGAAERLTRRTMISPTQAVAHAQAGRIKELERALDVERMANLRAQQRIDVLTQETYQLAKRLTDAQENVKLLLASQGAAEFAHIAADETGLYVIEVATQRRYRIVDFTVEPRAIALAAAREALNLCWYPYLQDERCKRPRDHEGDHGPAAMVMESGWCPNDQDCDGMDGMVHRPVYMTPGPGTCNDTGHYYAPDAQTCYCGNTGMAANV